MTAQRKGMNELNHNLCPCNPRMAKEMTIDQAYQINHGPSDKAIQSLTIMRAVTRCVEFHPPNNNLHVVTPNVQGTQLSGRDQAEQLVDLGTAQHADT
jgi:hypothetical protein